jgi:choline kinase
LEADYRFGYDHGKLRRFGKNLRVEDTNGEYVGIAKIHRSFVGTFRAGLEVLISAQQHNLWWEDVLFNLCAIQRPICVVEITDSFWAEVDYIEDFERIQAYLRNSQPSQAMPAPLDIPMQPRLVAV